MNRPWRLLILPCCLLVLCGSFTACDSIQSVKDKFLGGKDDEVVTAAKPRKTKKTGDEPVQGPNAQVAVEPPADAAPAEPAAVPPPPAAQNNPAPAPAQPESAGPITVVDHFGGVPVSLNFSSGNLYAGFGRKLIAFDPQLKANQGVFLEKAAEKITVKQEAGSNTLYVQEADRVLEIVRVPETGAPEILKSFKVEGPFEIFILPHAFTPVSQAPADAAPTAASQDALAVTYLPDKVQMLNLNNPAGISVVGDIPIANVAQAYPAGNYLYLAKENSLEIADRFSAEIRASIPIGTRFRILGVQNENGQKRLFLALKSPKTGKWAAFQSLPLSSPDLKVTGLGIGTELAVSADEVILDPQAPLVYLLREGKISIFDLIQKKEWTSPKDLLPQTLFTAGGQNSLYLASETAITKYDYQLPAASPPVAPPTPPVAATDPVSLPAAPPAVPAPSVPTFTISREQILNLASNVEIVSLLGAGAVALANAPLPEAKTPPLSISKNIALEGSALKPLWFPGETTGRIRSLIPTNYGILIVEESGGKIYALGKSLESVTLVALQPKSLHGLAGDPSGTAVYATGIPKPDKPGGEEAPGITLYRVSSDGSAKKEAHLPLNAEVGGLKTYGQAKFALVACGSEGVCQVDLGGMKLAAKIASSRPGAIATEILISPLEGIAYVFNETQAENFISLLDLKASPPKEISLIPSVASKKEQFRHATFSAGGQKFLLPQDDGLLIIDVKNPKAPAVSFKWPVGKVHSADVTNQGKKVCVALGKGGVDCGELQ